MIGWLPHSTNPVYAGTRIRCLTPLRLLQQRGLNVEIFDPAHADQYRVVVIQGLRCRPIEGDPATGDGLLGLVDNLRQQGCQIIVEDCDNHFYNPQNLPEWNEMADRLRALFARADHLVASTTAVAEVFRRETATQLPIAIIGDAVENAHDLNFDPLLNRLMSWRRKLDWVKYLELARAVAMDRLRGRRQLVWFGSHGSTYADGGMRDILTIQAVLERINVRTPICLTVISNSRTQYEKLVRPMGIPTRYFDWSRVSFLAALALHEIAVVPITRTPFTVCKSNNRIALALQCGLNVCADNIPSYAAFREVSELDNWEPGLEAYLNSRQHQQQHIAKARQIIAAHWSARPIADEWQRLLEQVSS